ncbi:NHL repeat-containing protein [Paenibacillus sp. M1]|uniref:NHL repeat-containing protein n=1 Tax=Paenibacillus haidiansis TaxID=1574488 RepID=A0ABU7VQ86_9BACL
MQERVINVKVELIAGQDNCFNYPSGVTYDKENKVLYIADLHNNRVCMLDEQTRHIHKLTREIRLPDGTTKFLDRPLAISIGAEGGIYIADAGLHEILRLNKHRQYWETLAYNCSDNGITSQSSPFCMPSGIAVDDRLNVYTNDFFNNRLCMISPEGNLKCLTADNGEYGFEDGDINHALINKPYGVCVSGSKLYFADTGNNVLRFVDLNLYRTETVWSASPILHPVAVAAAPDDTVIICEQRRILLYSHETASLTTLIDKEVWKILADVHGLPAKLGYTGAVTAPYNGLIYWVDTVKGMVYKLIYDTT